MMADICTDFCDNDKRDNLDLLIPQICFLDNDIRSDNWMTTVVMPNNKELMTEKRNADMMESTV